MRRALLIACALAAPLAPGIAVAQDAGTEVAVLDRAVTRGERLAAADFALESVAGSAARGALSVEDAAGMEAARNLRAGSPVRRSDIRAPQLVRRGEPVTIRVVQGGLRITTTGRALADGAEGEIVRVVASSTNRTLEGVVDGSGSVRIATP